MIENADPRDRKSMRICRIKTFEEQNNKLAIEYVYGLIDTTGRVIVTLGWDFLDVDDTGELFLVTKDATPNESLGQVIRYNDGKSGYLNKKGEVVIPIEYSYLGMFLGKVAIFSKSGQYDENFDKYKRKAHTKKLTTRQLKKKTKIDSLQARKSRIQAAERSRGERLGWKPFKKAKYGIINVNGQIVAPEIYDNIDEYYYKDSGYFVVQIKDKFGAYDSNGTLILDVVYNNHIAVSAIMEKL